MARLDDEAVELVPDDDPDVIAGMKRLAELRTAGAEIAEIGLRS